MKSLMEMVDNKGRISYNELKTLAVEMPLTEFIEEAEHPFLIGKELYDGVLRHPEGNNTNTMKFSSKSFFTKEPDVVPNSQITHSIYYLKKGTYSMEPENTYAIGRNVDNDIVIADFVVSKRHAKICMIGDLYFIMDIGSTNGTKVNYVPIEKNVRTQIFPGCTISFGRLAFIFAHPLALYRGLRNEIFGA